VTSIKKDEKRGTYYFVLDGGRDPITKKRTQFKRSGFESKQEAKVALATLQLELENGSTKKKTNVTFGDYVNEWFDSKKIKLKPSTKSNYEEQIKNSILPILGALKLNEFNDNTVQHFINTLHNDRGLSPATIRATYGMVREIVYSASRKGYISDNLLHDISLPRETKKLRVWNDEQIQTFLNAPEKILNLTRLFIGYSISLQTGMRMGEVLGLTWSDIDFDKKIIRIRQTLTKIDDVTYGFIEEGKTASAIRIIYIPDSLIKSLREHKSLIEKERKVLGSEYSNYNLVVCTRSGNWVHPNNFRRGFKVIVEQLDIPMIRVHDLRHTHATFLLNHSVNPKIIQERLGHKNINITLQTYSHALPSMQLEAASKFDDIFNNGD
jgi:integrase